VGAYVTELYGGLDYLGTYVTEFYIECIAFYRHMFTLRWSHYGVYAYTPGRAITSDSDGTGHSTRVYAVKCAWDPVAVSYPVR
jgi:hypothetical protein